MKRNYCIKSVLGFNTVLRNPSNAITTTAVHRLQPVLEVEKRRLWDGFRIIIIIIIIINS
jgi:hypothetical protein